MDELKELVADHLETMRGSSCLDYLTRGGTPGLAHRTPTDSVDGVSLEVSAARALALTMELALTPTAGNAPLPTELKYARKLSDLLEEYEREMDQHQSLVEATLLIGPVAAIYREARKAVRSGLDWSEVSSIMGEKLNQRLARSGLQRTFTLDELRNRLTPREDQFDANRNPKSVARELLGGLIGKSGRSMANYEKTPDDLLLARRRHQHRLFHMNPKLPNTIQFLAGIDPLVLPMPMVPLGRKEEFLAESRAPIQKKVDWIGSEPLMFRNLRSPIDHGEAGASCTTACAHAVLEDWQRNCSKPAHYYPLTCCSKPNPEAPRTKSPRGKS